MNILFFAVAFLTIGHLSAEAPEKLLKRIHAHLLIKDFPAACQEAVEALEKFPDNQALHAAYIRSLAHAGNERQMWEAWNAYAKQYPEQALVNQDLHEIMAWGTIWKGAQSPLPMIRLCALLGAFFGNDAKSTTLLKKCCEDSSVLIRSAAVQLISKMRDAQLCDTLLILFSREKNWKVRLEMIKALGKMKIKSEKPTLLRIIADTQTSAEEKSAATTALIALMEEMDRQEIVTLAKSNRAGLRLLACQAVGHLKSERDIDLMAELVTDNNAEVRAAALHTLGLLPFPSDKTALIQLAQARLKDLSPETAVTAAWLLTLLKPGESKTAFMPLMLHPKREIRLLASAALAATGKYGLPLALELFGNSRDPFVQMNLALGLVYQQTMTRAACQALENGLRAESGRWMWSEETPFRVLAPSTLSQEEEIPNAPEAFNQLTRLEILNILATMKYPGAEQAIRTFLQQRRWGLAGLAAALLLMEGDETSLELVEDLLGDPDAKVQMEAALTLSLWGGKEEAISTLESGYGTADRETKEKILEGLGKVGSRRSIPFLVNKLQEPQQILRIIAASALLQCLYH